MNVNSKRDKKKVIEYEAKMLRTYKVFRILKDMITTPLIFQ